MRQYVSEKMPDKKGKIRISGKDCRYMQQILRLKRGDALDVRLPDGNLALMEAIGFTKNYVDLMVSKKNDISIERGIKAAAIKNNTFFTDVKKIRNSTIEPNTKIRDCEYWLLQFLTKPQKMDLIIRQAVECGIAYIIPVRGAFSPMGTQSDRASRWNRIVKEARQQSGSSVATRVLKSCSLEEGLNIWQENVKNCTDANKFCSFVLNEDPLVQNNLFQGLLQKPEKAILAVGCEGGISDEEMKSLLSADFTKIHFNTNILRAETASLYGIAALQSAVMEFKSWK